MMYRMIPSILAIAHDVKMAALQYYYKKCYQIYNVAFMQWRRKYKTENKEMVEYILSSYIYKLNEDLKIKDSKHIGLSEKAKVQIKFDTKKEGYDI